MTFRSTAVILSVAAAVAQEPQGALEHFEKKVRPVLAARCYACHSSASGTPQGGLSLDSAAGIKKGGNSGAPLVQAGDPDASLLVRAIRQTDSKLKMPPMGKPLAPEVVADIEAWVRAGAVLPADVPVAATTKKKLWSLERPQMPTIPTVKGSARNDIDRFVLARLEGAGLTFSPGADKRTLIRRASYDLTGLPPSANEIDAFVKDPSPQAYENLIERLLASPRYGERWGRHWLDVARYADSVNDSVNTGMLYPWSYTYRDWVIQAINSDMPYDKFVLYQLAADRLSNPDPKNLAALGFLSLGREFPNSYAETVDDRIDAVTRGFLGLTVACARCHDHKYDPIPTKDYYSLYSIFSNIREPEERPLTGSPSNGWEKRSVYEGRLDQIRKVDEAYRLRRNAERVAFFKTQTADYLLAVRDAERLGNPEIEELIRDRQLNLYMLKRWRKYLEESKASNEPVFRVWHAAAAIPDNQFAVRWPEVRGSAEEWSKVASLRDLAAAYAEKLNSMDREEPFPDADSERWRAVSRGPDSPVDVPLAEFTSISTEGDNNNTYAIHKRYTAMLAQAAYDGAPPRAMAVEDLPKLVPGHVFIRGNPNNPGAATPPHFLTCLGGSEDMSFRDGAGRLELAKAIIDPANPLTARVIVNRAWMQHFGAGLVRTPSDFGFRGDLPTHPELLDYLAIKFVDSGWSLKKLHRMIMTSAAYRQASADNEAARKLDPENQLLWRMNRRRLDIESLRDSALAAAGRLDLTSGGLPFSLTAQPSVPRRTVYGFIERGRIPGMLSAFDFASPDQHAPIRFVTTVPQQALFFLNSPLIAEQARYLAERAQGATPEDRIRILYRDTFGRDPEPRELEAGKRFVAQASAADAAPPPAAPVWQYGTGSTSFAPFAMFVGDRWQGGGALPAAKTGKAVLTASGGEPGEERGQSVIRRWVSPISGKVAIEGTLRHGQPAVPYGDGVRGRVVTSRQGEIAMWNVNGSSAETKLTDIAVEPGDTIDFIVDGRDDAENNGFSWAPTVRKGEQTWNAREEFAGPVPQPLTIWERYAQVLLQTNEFAFVD